MSTGTENSEPLPGEEDGQFSAAAKAQLKKRISELSSLQQDRVYNLHSKFGDKSFEIVDFFNGKKVPGQWNKFTEDVVKVNTVEDEWYPYFITDLTNHFKLNEGTGLFEIIYAVGDLRTKHKLPALGNQPTKEGEADFGKVFLYDKGTDEQGVYEYTHRVKNNSDSQLEIKEAHDEWASYLYCNGI